MNTQNQALRTALVQQQKKVKELEARAHDAEDEKQQAQVSSHQSARCVNWSVQDTRVARKVLLFSQHVGRMHGAMTSQVLLPAGTYAIHNVMASHSLLNKQCRQRRALQEARRRKATLGWRCCEQTTRL